MILITASTTACNIVRGSQKTLNFEIADYDENDYNLANHDIFLLMYTDHNTAEASVKLEGTIVDASEGKVSFLFEREHTEELLARAYDADIMVKETGSEDFWPAWRGSIGVLPFNPVLLEAAE